MGRLLRAATRRIAPAHIRYVRPVPPETAPEPVARVYRQVETDFGMLAPPVALHAPAPPVLAACWSILRETLVVSGRASRADKEAVAAAVSVANRCPYCLDVHGAALTGLLGGQDAARIAAGGTGEVTDPRLRALVSWARTGAGPEPFPPEQRAELVGVALVFHYINRMVNVFLRDSPLPAVPRPAERVLRRTAASVLGRLGRVEVAAGASLDLLPDAGPLAGTAWATSVPHIAEALNRAGAAIAAAGERSVPAGVRELVEARLADPRFAGPGISARAWLDEAVQELPAADRPAGRVALLTAYASYRVTPELVAQCRSDDAQLVELTAWAAFAAARATTGRFVPDEGKRGDVSPPV
ncbi:carboxymuconolactone decarboxylase family protein [Micromonospora sp. NPDC005223]|uniref:carboxymuconolactone decarboxylase family protein n=1 Tax=unclassified Micromonospora TaxID=2617518 RepID=UPI0033A6BF46